MNGSPLEKENGALPKGGADGMPWRQAFTLPRPADRNVRAPYKKRGGLAPASLVESFCLETHRIRSGGGGNLKSCDSGLSPALSMATRLFGTDARLARRLMICLPSSSMNRYFRSMRTLLSIFALSTISILAAESTNSIPSTAKIADLRCEFQTNPTAVNTPLPRFSWRLESEEKGWLQSSYHLLAASTPELLAQNKGDLWDSGTVKSSSSQYVFFGGGPLASGQKVYWKVQATDRSDRITPWSKESTFAVKLTGPEPLPAHLIHPESKLLSTIETSQPTLNAINKAASNQIGQITKVRDLGLFLRSIGYHVSLLPQIEPWINHLNCEVNSVGYYPATLPSDGSYGSTQSDAAIYCMYHHWQMTGDTTLLQKNWRTLYRYAVARSQADPELIGKTFGNLPPDTLPKGDPTPPEFVHLVTEAINLRILKEIGLNASNSPYELKFFDKDIEGLKKQFSLKHIRKDGTLQHNSLTAYLFALSSGLLPSGDVSESFMSGFMAQLDRIKPENLFSESPFVTANILPVLTRSGQFDRALALAMAQNPERLSPSALAAISEWLITIVAGIETQSQGFQRMHLAPRVPETTDLTFVRAHYDSPTGRIFSAWERKADAIHYSFTVPPNTTCVVDLQLGKTNSLTSGNNAAESIEGVKAFKRGDMTARFLLLPGTYDFRAGQ